MEKILTELVTTAPSAVACIIIVVLFLKHLSSRDEILKKVNEDAAEARKLAVAVQQETNRIIGEQNQVMREVVCSIKDCQTLRGHWLNALHEIKKP